MRRAIYVILALLILLVAGTLLLLVHPILFTGRSYEFTLRRVEHSPEGMITLTYDDVLTYDTAVLMNFAGARGQTILLEEWDGKPRSFLHWPRREQDRTLTLYLNTAEERAKGVPDSPALRQRWLLKEGTYRIRPGDRLVMGRLPASDGKIFEMTMEATSGR